MITTDVLRAAAAAARANGASGVDVFHRRSRTRFLGREPNGGWIQGTRVEEGMGVRAWTAGQDRSHCGFAGGTGESASAAVALGHQAAGAATGGLPSGPSGEAPLVPGDDEPMERPPVASPSVFDPAVLRLTPAELRRFLERCQAACGALRRPGLLWALGIEVNCAVIESRLVRCDGELLSRRSSLVSVQARFPTAFGLGRLEMVTRRLVDLEPSLLSRMLASYPAPAARLARAEVRLSSAGDTTLTLAPPLAATLIVALARRAAHRGRPFAWDSTATLDDNPLLDWGPGSIPWDADGRPITAQRLGGRVDASDQVQGRQVVLPVLRTAVRQRPVAAATNVVLSGVPPGAGPGSRRRLHLLEAVGSSGGTILARGVARGPAGDEQAVLACLRGPLESLFSDRLRAGSWRAFFPVGMFASAPELMLPGVAMEMSS